MGNAVIGEEKTFYGCECLWTDHQWQRGDIVLKKDEVVKSAHAGLSHDDMIERVAV